MNRRGEKRVGALRWEKSPLFTKITREMNQQHIGEQIIVIYIFRKSMEKVTYLENQAFSTVNLRQ